MTVEPTSKRKIKYEAICINNNQALVEFSNTLNEFDKSYPINQWFETTCNKKDDCSYTNCICKHGGEKPNLRITKILL